MPPRTFVTTASYKAEDPNHEFSFDAGERFIESANPEASPDDAWILVHQPNLPDVQKYVPVHHLSEEKIPITKYRQPRTSSGTVSNDSSIRVPTVNAELVSAISTASSDKDVKEAALTSTSKGDILSSGFVSNTVNTTKAPLSDAASSGAAFGNTLAAIFKAILEKHEAYFTTVAKKREESFSKISSSINDASAELARCRERNSAIREQITELDAMIAAERARWQKLSGDKPNA